MQTFKKEERLSGQKKIEELFSTGNSFYVKPIKVIWMIQEEPHKRPARILISVSKRSVKKAVDRNLIKRRIREAYRKNKESFYSFLKSKNGQLVFAMVYSHAALFSYQEIEEKIILILKRLQSEYEKGLG